MKKESLVWFYIVIIVLSVMLIMVGTTVNDTLCTVFTSTLGVMCIAVAGVHLYNARS